MNDAQALNRPDAVDLTILEVQPQLELESCNHLLDDHDALERFYQDNGYILLRDVLNRQSVEEARDAMLKVAADLGLTEEGDPTGKWTGKPFAGGMEESPVYTGIATKLIEHPDNLKVMEKILGEPACQVPNVQYRTYPPNGPITRVHQDGFYSPGIHDYKPVWVTLTPCTKEMGGLALAVKQNKRGYLHNVAKGSPFPIPSDAIPPESWATTDYMPGDVLIVNPYTPHASLPNNSDRLRISFDSRVQSAARPSAFAATVKSVTPHSVTVDTGNGQEATYTVNEDTFIRVLNPGIREKFEDFADYTEPGMRIIVVKDGDTAVMLRKASEG